MPFRIFDAEGKVSVDDSGVDKGLARIRAKVRETVERVDSMEGTAQLKADATQLDKEIDRTRQKLRSVDRQKATATADMDLTQFDVAEAKLKAKIAALEREKIEIDVRMGRDLKVMDRTLTGLIQRLRGVGKASPWQDVQKLGNALHNARITLGPLSLSLRGLIVAMLTLAPLVTATAGALVGLSASLGSALVAGAGLGVAALGAFGLAMTGVILIARPMIKDLVAVKKAQDAYNKAVADYGPGSDQANTALKKLRSNLAATSPELRHSWRDLKALSDQWTKLTKDARPQFFKTVAEGIRTARELMPTFARQSADAFRVVNRGMREWLQGLRTAEAQDTLAKLMHRANTAIGPLMAGLGNIATFLARVSVSFSRFFKPLAEDFEAWTQGLADGAGNTKRLNNVVDTLMDSFRSWVHLLHEVGRLIGALFIGGAKDGNTMVDAVSDLVGKWADFLETKEGQRALHDFLMDSWDTVKKVANVLSDIATLIDDLASAGKPVVDWLLEASDAALDLFHHLDDSTGAGDELVTGLAGLIILRKAVGWAGALGRLLGGGAILGALSGLGRVLAQKIVFNPEGIAAGLRTAVLAGFRGIGLGAAAVLLGELSNAVRQRFRQAFDSAGVPGVIRDALTKAFDFTGIGQLGRAVDAVKHPIDAIKRAWENLGKLPGVQLVVKLRDLASRAAPAIWRRVKDAISGVISFVFHLPNPISAARSIWNRVKGVIMDAIRFVFSLPNPLGAARSIWNRVKGIISDAISFVFNLPDVAGKARAIWDTVADIMSQGISLSINVGANLSGIPGKLLGKLGLGGGGLVLGFAAGGRSSLDLGSPITAQQASRAMDNGRANPMGGKIFEPRMINNFQVVGEQTGSPEYIIPTNPAYRGRARRLLAEAVSVIGAGFARGARAAGKHRPRRPKKVYSGSHYLAPVQALENEIAIKDNALTQLDSRYGTDSRFKPMVDDDGQRIEENITWHLSQLRDLEDRARELSRLENRLAKAIEKAHKQLRAAMDAWGNRRPDATIIKGSGSNKKRVDNPAFKTWANKMEDLRQAYGEVPLSDAQQARFRSDSYATDAYSYNADQREARETQSAPLSSGGMDAFLARSGLLDTLRGLNLSVAQAAATIGDTSDDRAAQASLAGFWESVIGQIGPGGDKELLTEAYNNLASARQGASDTGGIPEIGTQIATFNQARDDLFREFGGNMLPRGGGIVAAIAGGVSQGVISGLSGSGANVGQVSGAGVGSTPAASGTTFNQTNNYAAPPPDPHTFVRSMAWEAQAL